MGPRRDQIIFQPGHARSIVSMLVWFRRVAHVIDFGFFMSVKYCLAAGVLIDGNGPIFQASSVVLLLRPWSANGEEGF